jgi:hypothetical protein
MVQNSAAFHSQGSGEKSIRLPPRITGIPGRTVVAMGRRFIPLVRMIRIAFKGFQQKMSSCHRETADNRPILHPAQ